VGENIKSPEFLECLNNHRIRAFSQGKALAKKELDTAEKDLSEAEESFQMKKYKWATIQSYYSMFHSARALLYNENLREKSHYCLIISLKALYVDTGKLSNQFVDGLKKGKNLRENADYYDQWSEIGAMEMAGLAKEFFNITTKILK
jgi:uncharacterized protein (UPF0332 family)